MLLESTITLLIALNLGGVHLLVALELSDKVVELEQKVIIILVDEWLNFLTLIIKIR